MFVDDPIVLLVSVSVVALPVSVSVAFGSVHVRDPVAPDVSNFITCPAAFFQARLVAESAYRAYPDVGVAGAVLCEAKLQKPLPSVEVVRSEDTVAGAVSLIDDIVDPTPGYIFLSADLCMIAYCKKNKQEPRND